MPVHSLAKGVRISPRKVKVVTALVRNRTVADALVILEHTPRRGAQAIAKAIKSAAANAEHNYNYKPSTLRITEVFVTAGPRMKRFMPAARGSANKFQHKTSHIRVSVDGELREVKKAVKAEVKKETK